MHCCDSVVVILHSCLHAEVSGTCRSHNESYSELTTRQRNFCEFGLLMYNEGLGIGVITGIILHCTIR